MKFNFCPGCGVAAEPGARFCTACGVAFHAGSAAAPPLIGTITLALLILLGGGFWLYYRLAPPSPRPLKPGEGGAGGAVASGASAAGTAVAGPQGHPPIQLPDEIKSYIANLQKDTEAKPKDVAAWETLARVQYRASRLDPGYVEDARRSYEHLVELDPKNLEGLRGLGNVNYDLHSRPQAAEFYRKYLAIKPDDPEVRTDLGTMYYENGQPTEAIAEYKQVVKANPSFFQAYFNLGIVYDSQGNHAEARTQLEKARDLATDANVKSRIATLLEQTKEGGSFAEAAANLEPAPAPAAQAAAGAATGDTTGSPANMDTGSASSGAPQAGGAPSGAGSFNEAVEQLFRSHPIAGPKVQKVEWPERDHGRVVLSNFPMEQMPPFMRDKYLDRMRAGVADAQQQFHVDGRVSVDLVDQATGTVMARVEPQGQAEENR